MSSRSRAVGGRSVSDATCSVRCVSCQSNIRMEVDSVSYTPAAAADLQIFDNFDWPAGTAAVTPELCEDFNNGCDLDGPACCRESTCCGGITIQEDDGVTLE